MILSGMGFFLIEFVSAFGYLPAAPDVGANGEFAAIAVPLFVVVVMASYIPARRATRLDPLIVLRYE